MTTRAASLVRRLGTRHPGVTFIGLPCLILLIVANVLWFAAPAHRRDAGGSGPTGIAPIAQNRPAPDFDLPRLSGSGRLALHSLRGRVVVMNFWASWCTACRHEAPALDALAGRYRGTDVAFVGVDHGDEAASARSFVQRYGVTYPSVVDGSDTLLGTYGAVGLPITYVIGRDGRIRYQVIGLVDPGALRRAIDRVRATT